MTKARDISALLSSSTTGGFTSGDTTPSVAGYRNFNTLNFVPTTITALDNGYRGQEVMIVFNDSLTTIAFSGVSSYMRGNGGVDWSPQSGDFMRCKYNGVYWHCLIGDSTL